MSNMTLIYILTLQAADFSFGR